MRKKRTTIIAVLLLLLTCLSPSTVLAEIPQDITTLMLTPYYARPASLNNSKTLYMKGLGTGEYVELKVTGTIKNVRLVKLGYNSVNDCFYEEGDISSLNEITNQTLVISTYHTCGMPQEKLVWTAPSGEEDSYTMAEDGKDGLKSKTYTYYYSKLVNNLIELTALSLPNDFSSLSALDKRYALELALHHTYSDHTQVLDTNDQFRAIIPPSNVNATLKQFFGSTLNIKHGKIYTAAS